MVSTPDMLRGGEDQFLRRLAVLTGRRELPRGTIGVGDDAAVLPGAPRRVVTMDLLVEGEHFRLGATTPENLARRALEANLSDIAAMGARPSGTFLGLAWPTTPEGRAWIGRLVRALVKFAAARGAPLLGGDTVKGRAGGATLALTVVGVPWPGGPVLRSGGRPDDVLAVTGPLGASVTGLDLLEGRIPRPADRQGRELATAAIASYRTPQARLDLARPLARGARALMDLSDGLGLDLPRLAAASGCGFEVTAGAIPIHPAAARFSSTADEALDRALSGGEDFELLAAIQPRRFAAVRAAVRRLGGDLVAIGRLLGARAGNRLRTPGGKVLAWPRRGWDPFVPDHIVSLDDVRPSPVGKV